MLKISRIKDCKTCIILCENVYSFIFRSIIYEKNLIYDDQIFIPQISF